MKTNVQARNTAKTYEGAPALPVDKPERELRRAVASCLLFENQFYESGAELAKRIAALVQQVPDETVAQLAIEARTTMGLRHVPLFLAVQLCRKRSKRVATLLPQIIQRADELAEFLALYWKDGRKPLAAQAKLGLAAAFTKFSPYSLAKYNRDGAVKLRDVLFLTHPNPRTPEQAEAWKKLVDGTLESPDTWEVALSSGADKKETWERLITEQKLGALALLRNLRNMEQAKVDQSLVKQALALSKTQGILPWQFISAAKTAPWAEQAIEGAMLRAMADVPRLHGRTALLVDVSGSMSVPLSGKSDRTRIDAASALAIYIAEVAPLLRVFTFSNGLVEVPARHGFALRDAIDKSQPHSSTMLGAAVRKTMEVCGDLERLIVLTDEQSHDPVPEAPSRAYMVNVASYKPLVETASKWTRINGFSDRLIEWIRLSEAEAEQGAGT